ncbi:MAG: nucleotide-binding protein [Nitrosopumilus sp.]|nr:nucleotide-binding protein [Nitrosopumilus sp.]MDH3489872.1 nucleotide-binding protein [Nitrosopumilus sp.]MDH3516695.1 nucleotide-binding protein [Nitrosopumilus sp.]MDH3564704.1 nucleotide-binding protein [Nitrosopumilus sp.]MDH5417452.1 nucleotide-binding protein [Nitrosopumilus sp.]
MDFRILDSSAFYAGVPFRSSDECYTTSLVYDEIKHIKKDQDALGTLLETNRLKIREPDKDSVNAAIKASKDTGDFQQLSKQDISIIALCIEMSGEIISDDFAISNVMRNLGLKISPIMTQGIKDVGKWVHYCPGCRTNHTKGKECPICGTVLKRKLLKRKLFSMPLNK